MKNDLLPYGARSNMKLVAKIGMMDTGKLRSRKLGSKTVTGIKRLAAKAR